MCRLHPTPGNKILCTKAALKQAILAAVDEAHEIGFLAGQKEQHAYITYPGNPDRPAWLDIRASLVSGSIGRIEKAHGQTPVEIETDVDRSKGTAREL
jgi:hypothetical protein